MTEPVEPLSEEEIAKFSGEPYTPEDGFVAIMWGDWQHFLAIARDHARLKANEVECVKRMALAEATVGFRDAAIDQLRAEVAELTRDRDFYARGCDELREQLQLATISDSVNEAEANDLRTELDRLHSALEAESMAHADERGRLRAELDEARGQLRTYANTLQDRDAEVERLKAESLAHREAAQGFRQERNDLAVKCSDLKHDSDAIIASLRAQLAAVKTYLESVVQSVEADERHHYPPARVQVNAPLALIQVGLTAEKRVAQCALAACEPKP